MGKTILVNCMARRMSIELYSYEMTKGLLENNPDVYAIIPENIENKDDWEKLPLKKLFVIKTYNTKLEFLSGMLKLLFGEYRRIKKMLPVSKIDVVYAPFINLWTGIINSMFPKCEKVVSLHDPIPHSGAARIRSITDIRTTKKASAIVILSDKFRKFVKNYYKIDSDRIITLPLGSYSYKKYDNGTHFDYKGRINYLFFGRIEEYKGLHVLAEAYRTLSRKYDDISLTVVGNGDFSSFREEYNSLKNTEIINRWIDDEEIPYFFGGDNVISVLPYIDATQSGVVPIAMEFETPIIATKTGGLLEQVENGKTGIMIPPGDAVKLANAMEKLYLDEALRIKFSQNGIEKLKDWDWSNLGKKLNDFINSL